MRTPVTPLPSPSTSSTALFQTMSILPALCFSNSLSCMIFSARSLSRRCTSVTFLQMFDRYSASSTAVLPPPMIATSWSRKKKPSQVAQADTPRPLYFSSDERPRYFAVAPVAMISASQLYWPLSPLRRNGRLRQIDAVDVVEHHRGLEALGVLGHALHQLRALQAFDVAGPVVDVGRRHQLAALGEAGDQRRLEVGACGIDRSAVAGGAGTEDDQARVGVGRHV